MFLSLMIVHWQMPCAHARLENSDIDSGNLTKSSDEGSAFTESRFLQVEELEGSEVQTI